MLIHTNPASLTPDDMIPANILNASMVLSGELCEFKKILFTAPDEKFIVMIWENRAAVKLDLKDYPVDEFVTLLEGDLELVSEDGTMSRFKAGDSFLIVKGFNGTWRQSGRLRKYAVWNIR